MKKIVLCSGGTGGHIFPAISLLKSLSEENETVLVTLGTRPDQENIAEAFNNLSYDILGLKVETASDTEGVIIIDINPKSNAYEKNIRKSNIITEIGNDKISNKEDYENALEQYQSGDPVMIRIINDGNPRYEAFEIE